MMKVADGGADLGMKVEVIALMKLMMWRAHSTNDGFAGGTKE